MSKPRKKKNVLAVLTGIAVVAAVGASATTLGGLTVDRIGAETATIEAPVDNGVRVTWQTDYNATDGEYMVTGFNLDGDIPSDAEVRVTLQNQEGRALGKEYSSTDGGTNWAPQVNVSAQDVHGASIVVIDGTPAGN